MEGQTDRQTDKTTVDGQTDRLTEWRQMEGRTLELTNRLTDLQNYLHLIP